LFPEEDDEVLDYNDEDGIQVEPTHFIPVIPTLLINGSVGIGMGWSTNIPSYNIEQLITSVESLVNGKKESSSKLHPYTSGFTGVIKRKDSDSFISEGIAVRVLPTSIEVHELPVGVWTEKYKEYLSSLAKEHIISGFTEHHSSRSIKFKINGTKEMLDNIEGVGILKYLKLTSVINLSNMHAFDKRGFIKKYESPEEIIAEHFEVRLDAYKRRKLLMIKKATEIEALSRNKARFIDDIIAGNLKLFGGNTPKKPATTSFSSSNMRTNLQQLGFQTMDEIKLLHTGVKFIESPLNDSDGYSYLMRLPIESLVAENAQKLREIANDALAKLNAVRLLSEQQIWLTDLENLKDKVRALPRPL
jgi:DNA topoisomerase-2